jgi:hypothetical protein
MRSSSAQEEAMNQARPTNSTGIGMIRHWQRVEKT